MNTFHPGISFGAAWRDGAISAVGCMCGLGMYRFSGERLLVTQTGQPAGDAINLGILTTRP